MFITVNIDFFLCKLLLPEIKTIVLGFENHVSLIFLCIRLRWIKLTVSLKPLPTKPFCAIEHLTFLLTTRHSAAYKFLLRELTQLPYISQWIGKGNLWLPKYLSEPCWEVYGGTLRASSFRFFEEGFRIKWQGKVFRVLWSDLVYVC